MNNKVKEILVDLVAYHKKTINLESEDVAILAKRAAIELELYTKQKCKRSQNTNINVDPYDLPEVKWENEW
jgi:hypothetical protein